MTHLVFGPSVPPSAVHQVAVLLFHWCIPVGVALAVRQALIARLRGRQARTQRYFSSRCESPDGLIARRPWVDEQVWPRAASPDGELLALPTVVALQLGRDIRRLERGDL